MQGCKQIYVLQVNLKVIYLTADEVIFTTSNNGYVNETFFHFPFFKFIFILVIVQCPSVFAKDLFIIKLGLTTLVSITY